MARKEGFPFDELTASTNDSNSDRIVAVLDCCYSGALEIGGGKGELGEKKDESTAKAEKGEEIIWQNFGWKGTFNKKVQWMQLITNYRVYEYDIVNHFGRALLFPNVEPIIIANENTTVQTETTGDFYGTDYYLSGTGQGSTSSKTVGDVVFMSDGKPFITLRQISDPRGNANH